MTARRLGLLALVVSLFATGCRLTPPLTVGHRPSKIGQGLIVVVTNGSDASLHELEITIENPDGEVRIHREPVLAAGATLEVGWLKLEGWPIPPGSRVSVECRGFALPRGPITLE